MSTKQKSRGLEREYFSSVEIAEHFGVSAQTVLNWRDSGCPAIVLSRKVGGKAHSRFRLEDVKAWLASFSQKGASGASQEGGLA
ncbi:MAG: helix-turn-helix domain-containing protein [Candidatus Spyradosoma sp.]